MHEVAIRDDMIRLGQFLKLADLVDQNRLGINFTWLLLTGFLVLFMQVGFALLVTGLTRAKNAGHMMMMNLSSFVIALLAYYAVGFAFQFGGARGAYWVMLGLTAICIPVSLSVPLSPDA